MAITSGTKINFYNTDYATFVENQANVKDGSLFFLNDGSAGHGGRIYSGTNLVANVGFEEFSLTKSGTGTYITDITPTSFVADDGTLTVGLTLSTGTPAAAQNNYAAVKIAAASSAVTNQAGGSSAVTVGPNSTSDTLTFTPGNKWITLYGTANGDDIKVSHLVGTISGGSAGTLYGPTANVTQTTGNSTTIKVPQIKVDEAGHVTQVNDYTLTVVDGTGTDRAKAYFGDKSSNDVSLHVGPAATKSADGTDGRGVTFTQGTDISLTSASTSDKLTIAHATKNATAGTDTAMTIKAGDVSSFTHVSSLGTISNGHITGTYKTQQITIDLSGISNAVHWKGTVSSLPSRPSGGWTDYAPGDVIAVGGKEYILDNDSSTGTTGWREFGDEGNWVPKTRKVLGDGTYLTQSSTGVLSSDVTISHKALLTSGTSGTNYGSATKVPQIKVDAAGHVTSVSDVSIYQPYSFSGVQLMNNDSSVVQLTSSNDYIPSTGTEDEIILESANKWLHLKGDSNDVKVYIAHDAPGSTTVTEVGGIGINADTSGQQTSWTFNVITDVSTDEAKHVTYIEKTPLSIYSDNSDHAYLYLGKAANPTSTLSSGFTSNNTGAFINVKSGQDTTSALGDNHNIKIIGAKDVSVDVTATGTITVQHSTAVAANTTNGFKTFAVDAYGHVTSYTTKTATTFTVKADTTSVAAQSDFGTDQTLNFAKPSTSAADATKLKISGTGSSTGVTYDFGPVWQTL